MDTVISAPPELYSCAQNRPSAASETPHGLIPGPPGHSRPPHIPWGHCGRLGWPVVTCGGHPQPSRRPRTPFRYGCPRVCGSPAGDSGDPCRHQRHEMGSWGALQDHHGVQRGGKRQNKNRRYAQTSVNTGRTSLRFTAHAAETSFLQKPFRASLCRHSGTRKHSSTPDGHHYVLPPMRPRRPSSTTC